MNIEVPFVLRDVKLSGVEINSLPNGTVIGLDDSAMPADYNGDSILVDGELVYVLSWYKEDMQYRLGRLDSEYNEGRNCYVVLL
jgi:predicted RNA-binding protein with PUA domain